jgi:hypothetical protein
MSASASNSRPALASILAKAGTRSSLSALFRASIGRLLASSYRMSERARSNLGGRAWHAAHSVRAVDAISNGKPQQSQTAPSKNVISRQQSAQK